MELTNLSSFFCFTSCGALNISLVIGIILFLYTIFLNIWYRNLPPHPIILPFFGNTFSVIGKRIVERASEIKDENNKPSKLVSYSFLTMRFILINNLSTVKQLFLSESEFTSDRPKAVLSLGTEDRPAYGIINSPPPLWIHTRRFSLQILRELGFGKSLIQQSIEDQCNYLTEILAQQANSKLSFNITTILSSCSSDIMSLMLFGRKPALENAAAAAADDGGGADETNYVQMIEQLMRTGNRGRIFFPFLKHLRKIPFVNNILQRHDRRSEIQDKIVNYLQNEIQRHRLNNDNVDDNNCDFIDHFLRLQNKEKKSNENNNNEIFTDENLCYTLQDLFIAGTDTTSVTLSWALALLCYKQEIQEKVYQELIGVFGNDFTSSSSSSNQYPTMNQLTDCPYTRAVMSEVLRYGVTAPGSLPHTNTKDLYIDNYWIPKGSVIIANLYGISRDATLWKYPNEFYPEHFYNEKTNSFITNDNLISFSIGKRACLGEGLARQEFFMFLTTMLLKFRFEFDEDSSRNVEAILSGRSSGIVRSPNDFKIKVFLREN